MVSKDTPAFGPYVIQRAICTRPGVELLQAMFFNAGHRHRPVALRRTRPLHDGEHDKLVRAACAYAILQHADVVPVLDFGSLNNRTYIATPLVEGHNLLQVMARCAHRRQPFPFDVALFMTCRTLCALQYAHDHDQTHGDVSPTNVMVTREGKVQLADFGIRMASTRLRSPAGLNRGIGRRFACYLSPEQAQGDGPSPQADVFVAGILLYELLTGH
ncbi:MAG: protein kinase, partial [Myxococcota bacterium]